MFTFFSNRFKSNRILLRRCQRTSHSLSHDQTAGRSASAILIQTVKKVVNAEMVCLVGLSKQICADLDIDLHKIGSAWLL